MMSYCYVIDQKRVGATNHKKEVASETCERVIEFPKGSDYAMIFPARLGLRTYCTGDKEAARRFALMNHHNLLTVIDRQGFIHHAAGHLLISTGGRVPGRVVDSHS